MKKVLIVIVIIGIGLFVVFNYGSSETDKTFTDQLIELGYSKENAEIVANIVSDNKQELILNFEANDSLIDILSNPDYKEKNLEKYLNYFNKNKVADISDIIVIVNSGYDILNREYSPLLVSLIEEKYFIFDNLDRYLNYSMVQNFSANDIVVNVNCNLDKVMYKDISEANYKDNLLILVNKYFYLSEKYTPSDLTALPNKYSFGSKNQLRKEGADAFMEMSDAAILETISIRNVSAFRNYSYQKQLYDNYVLRDGKLAADNYSARAGHSEHQTGLSLDINTASMAFEGTSAFKWLSNNAYKYGFILRYPKGKEHITGYQYEPWHYRYVGKDAANIIKNENITLEEYYAYYVKKSN